MTTRKKAANDDASHWQRTALTVAGGLLLTLGGWWCNEVWTQVAHAGERINEMDARQKSIEALQVQQGEFNKRLLDLIETERLKKIEMEEERRREQERQQERRR